MFCNAFKEHEVMIQAKVGSIITEGIALHSELGYMISYQRIVQSTAEDLSKIYRDARMQELMSGR